MPGKGDTLKTSAYVLQEGIYGKIVNKLKSELKS